MFDWQICTISNMDLLNAKVVDLIHESIRIWSDMICSSRVQVPIRIKCSTGASSHG